MVVEESSSSSEELSSVDSDMTDGSGNTEWDA
jgi:hypothetical protein